MSAPWSEQLRTMRERQLARENAVGMHEGSPPSHEDVEFIETAAPLAVRQEQPLAPSRPPTFFGDMRPAEKVAFATEVADALKPILTAKKLTHKLNKKNPQDEFVELEGWQTCASMCQMSVKVEWTRKIPGGYEARAVVVRVDTGTEIGAGESMCLNTEENGPWKYAADYALMGMAQTRAQSRALRGVLAWILVLAGYKPTPSEEMPPQEAVNAPQTRTVQASPQQAAPKAGTNPDAFYAAGAFEIAVKLGLVPDDKVIFRQYCSEKYAGKGWAARLAELENLASLVDENEETPHVQEAVVQHDEDAHRKLEKRVLAICRAQGISDDARHAMTMRLFAKQSLTQLNETQLAELAASLEAGRAA